MKKLLILLPLIWTSLVVQAAEYEIDHKGAHAIIQFKISHLGYSWLLGRFNTFQGTFNYDDDNPAISQVKVVIDMASVDTNHAERDKHLRSDDFFAVDDYPEATFVSKKVSADGEGKAKITGDFTLRGVTKEIVLDASHIGGGKDPWGGFRQGFEGSVTLTLRDFGILASLGPASGNVEIYLSVEGIKK